MLPLHLQSESHIPLYVQLRDQLRALVHSGELRTGDRIPASRELGYAAWRASHHRRQCLRGTRIRGIDSGACGAGDLYLRRAGAAVYAAAAVEWEWRIGALGSRFLPTSAAKMALSRLMPEVPNECDRFCQRAAPDEYFPVEEFRKLLQCGFARRRAPGSAAWVLGWIRAAEERMLIEFLRDEGLHVRSEQLLITGGCQQAIDLLCKAFLRPGDAVALENPAYPGALAIFGARARSHAGCGSGTDPQRDRHVGLDIDALESVLMQNRVKFILVTPDFHNPTGTALAGGGAAAACWRWRALIRCR